MVHHLKKIRLTKIETSVSILDVFEREKEDKPRDGCQGDTPVLETGGEGFNSLIPDRHHGSTRQERSSSKLGSSALVLATLVKHQFSACHPTTFVLSLVVWEKSSAVKPR